MEATSRPPTSRAGIDLQAEGQKVLDQWNRTTADIDSKAWGTALYFQERPSLPPDRPYTERVVNPYCYFPFFWQDTFPEVGLTALRNLAEGSRYYLDYLLHMDNLMDGDAAFEPLSGITASTYHYRALRAFFSVVPPASPIWRYFDQYSEEYLQALLLERLRHTAILLPFPDDELRTIAAGKSAIAKWIVASLAGLSGREEALPPLAASLDSYYIGLQQLDDIRDWRTDYQRRNFTHLLSRCIFARGWEQAVNSDAPPGVDVVGIELFRGGHIGRSLGEADACFAQAIEHVGSLPCQAWTRQIEIDRLQGASMQQRILGAHELQKVRKIALASAAPAPTTREAVGRVSDRPKQLTDCALMAVSRLLESQRNQYRDAIHADAYEIELPGFPTITNVQSGVTFQQAVILDALLDADRAGLGVDRSFLEAEIKALSDAKAADVSGGWRYFHDFPVIPPDSDTLGAVLQALVKGRAESIEDICERAITGALQWGRNTNGSFETWLVDPTSTSFSERWIKAATDAWWGRWEGKDAEVTANLLYGLYCYDANRFAAEIAQGIAFLESRQSPEGFWPSQWYCGNQYGTYVCSRLLGAAKPASQALHAALAYLVRSQNLDGGWGSEGDLKRLQRFTYAQPSPAKEMSADSDPFNTALALLALACLHQAGYVAPDGIVAQGLRYLMECQLASGGWEKVEIGFTVRGKRPYGSEPYTTAFCLKALLSWSQAPVVGLGNHAVQDSVPYRILALHGKDPESSTESNHGLARSFGSARLDAPSILLSRIAESYGLNPESTNREWSRIDSTPRSLMDHGILADRLGPCLGACCQIAALPRQLDVYLVVGMSVRSLCRGIVLRNRPALILNLETVNAHAAAAAAGSEQRLLTLEAPVAREYCRAILALNGFTPTNLLEALWADGVTIAFSRTVFPQATLASHLELSERETAWCQQNGQYLWQGVKPYLQTPCSMWVEKLWSPTKTDNGGYPRGVGLFLGNKLIRDYVGRQGARTWHALSRTAPGAFIPG